MEADVLVIDRNGTGDKWRLTGEAVVRVGWIAVTKQASNRVAFAALEGEAVPTDAAADVDDLTLNPVNFVPAPPEGRESAGAQDRLGHAVERWTEVAVGPTAFHDEAPFRVLGEPPLITGVRAAAAGSFNGVSAHQRAHVGDIQR